MAERAVARGPVRAGWRGRCRPRIRAVRRPVEHVVLKAELDKLTFLRDHTADRLDLSGLPAGRRRMLAEVGRRSTNQAQRRTNPDGRYPVPLATLAGNYVEVLDELVQLLDRRWSVRTPAPGTNCYAGSELDRDANPGR